MRVKMLKLEDIARLAKVSKSSASLALNNKPGVSEDTKKKVMDIVQKYGYTPLRKPRKKQTKKRHDVSLLAIKSDTMITDSFQQLPFFNEMLTYFAESSEFYNTSLSIDTLAPEAITTSADFANREGTILLGTDLSAHQIKSVAQLQPNLVVVDTNYPNIPADFITMDNFQGGFIAAKYLIEAGFTEIGYIASRDRFYNFTERMHGFNAGMSSLGEGLSKSNMLRVSPISMKPNDEFEKTILGQKKLPQVFFCEDDYIALNVMKLLQSHHIQVPEDVAILGFDGIDETTLTFPEISTVRVPIKDIVNFSLRVMQDKLEGRSSSNIRCTLSTSLIERASTKK